MATSPRLGPIDVRACKLCGRRIGFLRYAGRKRRICVDADAVYAFDARGHRLKVWRPHAQTCPEADKARAIVEARGRIEESGGEPDESGDRPPLQGCVPIQIIDDAGLPSGTVVACFGRGRRGPKGRFRRGVGTT